MLPSYYDLIGFLWLLLPILLLFLLGKYLSSGSLRKPNYSNGVLFRATCAIAVDGVGVSFPLGEVIVYEDCLKLKYTKEVTITPHEIERIKLKSFLGITSLEIDSRSRTHRKVRIQGCNCELLYNCLEQAGFDKDQGASRKTNRL